LFYKLNGYELDNYCIRFFWEFEIGLLLGFIRIFLFIISNYWIIF